MLNSRSYARDLDVLNIGEEVASEKDLNDPNTRVYYHQVKGAVTHMPDGAQLTFRGGVYATQNQEVIQFLDKIANRRGTMVYTKDEERRAIMLEQATAVSDARVPAGDALATLGAGDDGKLQEVKVDESAALAAAVPEASEQKSALRAGVARRS